MKKLKSWVIALLFAIGSAFSVDVAHGQAAGSPDTTFGAGGIVTTTFSGQTVTPIGAVEQSNGDIVVISQFDFQNDAGTGVGVTRYTSAGKLDASFGTKGSTFTTFPNIIFQALWFGVQSNGAIVVAGGTAPAGTAIGANQGFGLTRFTANGALDTTFGTGGLVNTPIGPRQDVPTAFLLQPNGQIVMGGLEDGNGERPTNPDDIPEMLSIARYNSNGSLDTTFGTGGVSLLNIAATVPGPSQIALLANGDYLALGATFGAITTVEISAAGALKPSLSGAALVASSASAQSGLESELLFESNGDILTASGGNLNRSSANTVERFTLAGTLDPAFTTTAFQFEGQRRSAPDTIAFQSNGQILVGVEVNETTAFTGGIARLDATGGLDTEFGTGGQVPTQNPVTGLLIQTDGKIVAIESVSNDGISLARYLPN
jgi:uncharacterized delta-60 repeat protein